MGKTRTNGEMKENEKVANYVRKRGRNLRNTIFLKRGGF